MTAHVFACAHPDADHAHRCRPIAPLMVEGSLIFVCIGALGWWLETGLVDLDMDVSGQRGRVVRREA